MSEPFNLDSFKSDWQKIPDEKHYQSTEIFQMLQRKSMNAARWIFLISVLELVLTTISVIATLASPQVRIAHDDMFSKIGNSTFIIDLLYVCSIVTVIVFTYLFFQQYRRISVESSVNDLTHHILKFRRLVNYYFLINVALLFPIIILFVWVALAGVPEAELTSSQFYTILAIVAFVLITITLVFYWLYYYLIYGTFLRKLRRNARELDKIKNLTTD
ncbi:MAG: hypothetical protein Q4F57_08365 [Weeksellaceae bacterium]|nr:hypothetical protein [Weeksellaceae bacterium]